MVTAADKYFIFRKRAPEMFYGNMDCLSYSR